MAIAVNLWSTKVGELKRFLESYYDREMTMDDDVEQWIYVYHKPLEAADMISAVVDNHDKYQISVYIQMDQCGLHPVTIENHNDVIRGIFELFYVEKQYI